MSRSTHRSGQRQRREQVRGQIMSAAEAALREAPFRELSVESVMTDAGLTRTLFYRHFDDLADLVVRLLEEASTDLYEHERQLATADGEDPETIRRALEAPVAAMSAHGPLIRAVAEAASHDERIDEGYRALVERFGRLIEGYLRALAGRGYAHCEDPAQTARALNLMNLSYLLDVFGTPEPRASPEVALRTLTEIWLAVLHQRAPDAGPGA